MRTRRVYQALTLAALAALTGCASAPKSEETPPAAPEAKPEPAAPAPQASVVEPAKTLQPATLTASPLVFSPDGDGKNDTVALAVGFADPASASSWSLVIADDTGRTVREFAPKDFSGGTVRWDGRFDSGAKADSLESFKAKLLPSAGSGQPAAAEAAFSTDLLLIREGNKNRIMVPSIVFRAYTADFLGVAAKDREGNLKALDTLARILKTRAGTKIMIEGYAVAEHWGDPARLAAENREELIPLSAARAEAVKKALIERGVPAEALQTAAFGSANARAANSDLQNRWMNRRVEFVLAE